MHFGLLLPPEARHAPRTAPSATLLRRLALWGRALFAPHAH